MKLRQPTLLQFLGFRATGDLGPFTFYTTKKGNTVFFPKAPPTTPPSYQQIQQRSKFRTISQFWQHHSAQKKAAWELATIKLRLRLTGFDLFTWYHTVGDRQTIATIERLANLTLLDD